MIVAVLWRAEKALETRNAAIIVAVVALAIIGALISLQRGGSGTPQEATPGPSPTTTATLASSTSNTTAQGPTAWSPDGVIGEGEYETVYELANGNFLLYLRVEGDTIYIGMKGRTEGWLAIGIDPVTMMKDADMIIAWVDDDGAVHVVDAYSTGPTGPHPPDTQLGGTSDILEYGGRESGGWTIVELSRKLSTGDQYDKPLTPGGEAKIIYAMSREDVFTAYHDIAAGEATITIPG